MPTADSRASRRSNARRRLVWAALALLLPGAGLAARAREAGTRDPVVAGWIHASDSLERIDRWNAAESLATLALRRAEQSSPPDSATMTQALLLTGLVRFGARHLRDSSAFRALSRVLEIQRRVRRPDPEAAVEATAFLGRILMESNHPDSGLVRYQEARAIARRAGVAGDSVEANLSWLSGTALRRLSRPAEAEVSLHDALTRLERMRGPNDPSLGAALNELSGACVDQGRYAEARALLERAIGIIEHAQGPKSLNLISPLNRIAGIQHRTGDTEVSIATLQRALEITRENYGPKDVHLAPLVYNIGLRLLDFGDYSGAVRWFEAALEIDEATFGPGNLTTEAARTMLGVCEVSARDTAAALRHLAAAEQSLETKPLDPNQMLVYCYRGRAELQLMRGDGPGAMATLNRAIALQGTAAHPLIESAAELYELKLEAARTAGDPSCLDSTIQAMASLYAPPETHALASYQENLCFRARSEMALGRRDSAWAHLLAAERLERDRLESNVRALPDGRALEFSRRNAIPIDFLLQASTSGPAEMQAEVWDRVVQWRGTVREEVMRRRLPVAGDSSLLALHARWVGVRRRLAQAEVAGAAEAALVPIRSEAAEAERAYVGRLPGPELAADTATASLARVRAALGSDEALVGAVESFAGTDTARLIAFVLPPGGGAPKRVELGTSRHLSEAVASWSAALAIPPSSGGSGAAEASCRRRGLRVRALTWDRIAPLLGGARAVTLVPDGPLVDLPWAALPGRTSGYWIEDAPRMRVIESERALLEPRTESGRGLVAVGDPDFDRTRAPADAALAASVLRGPLGDCAGGGSLAFGALAGARAEAREVAAAWDAAHSESRARLLVGADATVEALEREAPGHAVLHLATHGVVWGDSCAPLTANARGIGGVRPLAGTARPRAKTATAAHAAEPPAVAAAAPGSLEDSPQASPWIGHRVWLALAGANHARDPGGTGLLTANDVSMLDLRGMQWVVLSACQSGVGDAWPREGSVGMQSAFRIAGARDVIASQWSIGDESTREWMRALYAARAGGATGAGDAAAAACRTVLAARRASKRSTHPFYWAGFTTVGL